MYETILKGLKPSKQCIHVILTSDGKRDIYSDFNKLLPKIKDYQFFYVIVIDKKNKNHIHLLIKNCPFPTSWFDNLWHLLHNCIARKFVLNDNIGTSIYLSTQKNILDVDCSEEWIK